MKKVAVFIGRFAPLHNGHIENIKYCLDNFDDVIVLVGSGNKRRTTKNPFDFHQIESWIKTVNKGIKVLSINDYIYNDQKWISQVQHKCYKEFPNAEFTLVGHHKDNSSYYLDMFPTWKVHETPEFCNGISATSIRAKIFIDKDDYFINDLTESIKEDVPNSVFADILEFKETELFEMLYEEKEYFKREDQKFESYPYKETLKFNCSDAVVVCEGHVLLIQRKRAPGKNTWALPGGFVNINETYKQASIRELYEETGLKVPEKVLNGSFKRSKIFDNPDRNIGIPRISNAFYFEVLPDEIKGFKKLPKIKAKDDAVAAKWVPLSEIKYLTLFDDHSDIIEYFVNLY